MVGEERRLIRAFPAKTTLWEILCYFEQTAEPAVNITRRSVAVKLKNQLVQYYEAPIVRVISKEFSGPETLERTTLASQGIVNGSVVLQVKFEKTQKDYSEVMALLPQKEVKLAEKGMKRGIGGGAEGRAEDAGQRKPQTSEKPSFQMQEQDTSKEIGDDELISRREVLILSKPTSSTLYASKVNTNEEDYELTQEMAIFYQNILSARTKGIGSSRDLNIDQQLKQKNNLNRKVDHIMVYCHYY